MEKATLEKFEKYKVSVLEAIEQAEADGVLTGVSLALETEILKVLQQAVSKGVEGSESLALKLVAMQSVGYRLNIEKENFEWMKKKEEN